MTTAPRLPDGLEHRPLRPDDSAAVCTVMAAAEMLAIGEVMIEEADIVADWQRPGFDLATSTVGVFSESRLIAFGAHTAGDRADAAVHPDWMRRGIGTWLADWVRDTARRTGARQIGMPVPMGSAGDRLLAELGYEIRWTSWGLELPAGATVQNRSLPTGYAIRAARPEEYPVVHDVIEDAFLEWSDRPRSPFEEFEARHVRRPGFEPWNLRVVLDQSDDVVGAGLLMLAADGDEGWIDKLAVRADQRNRGLAQALLVDAFAVAQAHGATRSTLATDSRTGALGLYERVGMVVTSTWVNRAVAL